MKRGFFTSLRRGFYPLPLAIVMALIMLSCVSKRQFLDSEQARMAGLDRERQLKSQLEQLDTRRVELEQKLAATLREVSALVADTTRMGEKIRTQLTWLNANLSEKERLNLSLQDKLREINERERTIEELQSMIRAQREATEGLLSRVKQALLGFNNDELTVSTRNGKVYVAMSDKLLFRSGSAQVDSRGKEALALLADVLNKQADIDVVIEGHTDNVPINTQQFKDNWDLSVVRATSVARILTAEFGMSPLRVLPSGRSEYMPVDDNSRVEGRAANRRTDIILSPRLDALYELLQQQ
ncbi:MAG: OmpA family protein [Bacteroidales bacterium]